MIRIAIERLTDFGVGVLLRKGVAEAVGGPVPGDLLESLNEAAARHGLDPLA